MKLPPSKNAVMQLTSTLVLPEDTACRTMAFIAQKGAGKTYAGMKLAELLAQQRSQVAAVDPTGVWWGLRADGKGAGLDFIVLGGEHGDAPLEPTGGELVADFINNTGRSVVLDLSSFESKAAQNRFLTAFATKLYHLKASNRTPLHLMLDEADEYAPQRPLPGEQALLAAFERIVRRGRSRGMGMTMITQRPACLSKNLLTQVDALACLRIVGKQDLDAVRDWMGYCAPDLKVLNRCLESLPKLEQGEMWFWSPSWLKTFQDGKVLPRQTFDSSSTPDATTTRAKVRMLDVNLEVLTADMLATIQRAAENDPKAMRARIADLERQLAAEKERPAINILTKEDVELVMRIRTDPTLKQLCDLLHKVVRASAEATTRMDQPLDTSAALRVEIARYAVPKPTNSQHDRDGTGYLPHIRKPRPAADSGAVGKPQQRILNALKLWENSGDPNPTLNQVGMFALLDPSGGHFSNVIGPLSSGGLITRNNGRVSLTDAGRAMAEDTGRPSMSEYHDVLRNRLEKRASKRSVDMLNVIIEGGGRTITLDEIAERVGMNEHGGHFSNTIGPISSLGFVTRQNRQVTPTDLLFPSTL